MINGIRASQAGISIDKAADYQMVLDERWPLVELAKSEIIDVKNAASSSAGTTAYIPIYKHDLGFLPSFQILPVSYSFSGNATIYSGMDQLSSIYADSTYIYLQVFKSSGSVVTINFKFFLLLLSRDCTKDFTAQVATPLPTQSSNASVYGIKILSKTTSRGINENNKSAYTLNSNAKMFAYQRHAIITAPGSGLLSIVHGLGYPPTYFLCRLVTPTASTDPFIGKQMSTPMGLTLALSKNTGSILTLRGAQSTLSGTFMYVIFKDPVDLAK